MTDSDETMMFPTSLKVGMSVEFDCKVFEHPYAPYYDEYKGHRFQIVAFHPMGHVQIKCVDDPSVQVKGHVHDDELRRLPGDPAQNQSAT